MELGLFSYGAVDFYGLVLICDCLLIFLKRQLGFIVAGRQDIIHRRRFMGKVGSAGGEFT